MRLSQCGSQPSSIEAACTRGFNPRDATLGDLVNNFAVRVTRVPR